MPLLSHTVALTPRFWDSHRSGCYTRAPGWGYRLTGEDRYPFSY